MILLYHHDSNLGSSGALRIEQFLILNSNFQTMCVYIHLPLQSTA